MSLFATHWSHMIGQLKGGVEWIAHLYLSLLHLKGSTVRVDERMDTGQERQSLTSTWC